MSHIDSQAGKAAKVTAPKNKNGGDISRRTSSNQVTRIAPGSQGEGLPNSFEIGKPLINHNSHNGRGSAVSASGSRRGSARQSISSEVGKSSNKPNSSGRWKLKEQGSALNIYNTRSVSTPGALSAASIPSNHTPPNANLHRLHSPPIGNLGTLGSSTSDPTVPVKVISRKRTADGQLKNIPKRTSKSGFATTATAAKAENQQKAPSVESNPSHVSGWTPVNAKHRDPEVSTESRTESKQYNASPLGHTWPSHSGAVQPYTEEDDRLIVKLKEMDGLSWEEIAARFPGRSKGSLAVGYSTKLSGRTSLNISSLHTPNEETRESRLAQFLKPVRNSYSTPELTEEVGKAEV